MTGYVGIADGPWACYVCAVFGDTVEGWFAHGRDKHSIRVIQTTMETDKWLDNLISKGANEAIP